MGFNKRYISKETLKSFSNNNNYEIFFNYFKANALIFEDNFSLSIGLKMSKLKIIDKDEIVNIMNECKKK